MCQNTHHKEAVNVKSVPVAIGPYSQAVIAGGFLYTSGQLPINPETGELERPDIKVQTKRILDNLSSLLKESGTCLEHVVKTTVFIKDLNLFSQFNEAYGEYFKESPPARSCVEVSRLPKDALVEIEAVALMED
ncbi:MAG: RidA family protein [Deltaproteobacteria bacterium]